VNNIRDLRKQLRDLILRVVGAKYASDTGSAADRLSRTLNAQQPAPLSADRYIDGMRIPCSIDSKYYYDEFFSTLDFGSSEDLLAAVAGMELDLKAMAKCHDLAGDVLSGWIYWVLYIKGYLQHKDAGMIRNNNVYYNYLTKYFEPQTQDPGLVQILEDPVATTERIALRFRDFDLFRGCAAHNPGKAEGVDPVIVILSDPTSSEADVMLVYEVGSDTPLRASIIDGYHRLFLARLFEVERVPCRMSRER
jgi:hypothetical protein